MSDLQCAATLLLARHGEAEYESSHGADEGGSLTARGREQARALAIELAGARVAHLWTSTLARAVQTGEIVAAALGVGVTTRSGLRAGGGSQGLQRTRTANITGYPEVPPPTRRGPRRSGCRCASR
ncbi:hypothetical protein DDE18_09990 [Nocardioides gansuensis]|uniref:Histidine phosphatase family protein n=1 Tax=Nocardioides gansuensis TaxID=2138300 RepID=A0A2T8FAF2_9ACTN|nr:histidine phosphatase family protein [Nocardioides gansuensis]PVG82689.1 hypothetical protein DDE18_09990 [Nocardioides gansuensis]